MDSPGVDETVKRFVLRCGATADIGPLCQTRYETALSHPWTVAPLSIDPNLLDLL